MTGWGGWVLMSPLSCPSGHSGESSSLSAGCSGWHWCLQNKDRKRLIYFLLRQEARISVLVNLPPKQSSDVWQSEEAVKLRTINKLQMVSSIKWNINVIKRAINIHSQPNRWTIWAGDGFRMQISPLHCGVDEHVLIFSELIFHRILKRTYMHCSVESRDEWKACYVLGVAADPWENVSFLSQRRRINNIT